MSSLATLLVVAATGGVHRMTQIMDLLNQAPDIPEEIQLLPRARRGVFRRAIETCGRILGSSTGAQCGVWNAYD